MPGLLDIPEEVMRQHLFPLLGHNDILRVRRVCKMTKDFATNYLWTPKKGHQGNWTLEIRPNSDDKNLQSFLQMELPPPSRLNINLYVSLNQSANLFEDANLEEFMRIYSKFVTHVTISHMEIPFTTANEIGFYESLVNLENLHCGDVKTGKPAQFQQKMATKGSCLIPSTFKKLKSFQADTVDCYRSFMTFTLGLKCLETISHFLVSNPNPPYFYLNTNFVTFLTSLIEQDADNKLKTIQCKPFRDLDWNAREVLHLFALCSDKGIKIKGLPVSYLDALLCNANGVVNKTQIFDAETRERVYREDYQRNYFIANAIHSLVGLDETAFLMELPYLEEITVDSGCQVRFWRRHGVPKWPNLKKMDIAVYDDSAQSTTLLNLLCERVERPKLEEFVLLYERSDSYRHRRNLQLPVPCPSNMATSFKNLKKLTLVGCAGNSAFFVTLWEGLRLLEHVELLKCHKLGNKGFIGTSKARPVFMKLEKLRHLTIGGIHKMHWFTDIVFREVFSRMKIASMRLSGRDSGKKPKVTVEGIKALLTGEFAESIEKFHFDYLHLHGLSYDERSELKAHFRSSKML